MRYVTRSLVEGLKYEMLCARTLRRQKAAKAALMRQGVAARVPIGKNWVPRGVTRDRHITGHQRGVLIRAINTFDATHPGIAMCIAILTALVYFHLASDPGKSEPATVHMHVVSPAN